MDWRVIRLKYRHLGAESDMFILIVEPEFGEMEAAYKILSQHNFVLGFVNSKVEAIKTITAVTGAARAKVFDFVIVEYTLPGMTGQEFQRLLNLVESGPRIIFTFLKATMKVPLPVPNNCQWLPTPFADEELLRLLA